MGECLKKIVVSAVNFTEGGPLSILNECLEYLSKHSSGRYEVIALVNDKRLFKCANIKFYSFPRAKKSWLMRLYYEYIYFLGFSKKVNPYLWLSLHDITPNVRANVRAVYCHNPAPFYKLTFKDAKLSPKFALFNILYRFLYEINIKKNNYVIVQQDWLRQEFKKLYKIEKIIVSHPSLIVDTQKLAHAPRITNNKVFFYPALPRIFKNFEVICEAVKILISRGRRDFTVRFTFKGNENRYAKSILRRFSGISQINFIGLLRREEIEKHYQQADCLLFSSKLETWGLPITEFKDYNKPILLSDLPFAHETAGAYKKAVFFNPADPNELAGLMEGIINNNYVFTPTEVKHPSPPFAKNWGELFNLLLD